MTKPEKMLLSHAMEGVYRAIRKSVKAAKDLQEQGVIAAEGSWTAEQRRYAVNTMLDEISSKLGLCESCFCSGFLISEMDGSRSCSGKMGIQRCDECMDMPHGYESDLEAAKGSGLPFRVIDGYCIINKKDIPKWFIVD